MPDLGKDYFSYEKLSSIEWSGTYHWTWGSILLLMLLMFLFLQSKSAICLYNSNDLVFSLLRLCMQDIWHHIHSLMPMRDAARAACVSRSFLRSWRCHPNLNFSKYTLFLNENACQKDESGRFFYIKVDHILKNHSGIGVKKLKIQINSDYSSKDSCFLNRWLQKAVTPGIEELTLILVPFSAMYNFPCSLLLNGRGDSIRYLHLTRCSFRPTVTLGLRGLTRLHLCLVRITGDELGCLLSHSLASEQLELRNCDRIVCLKVPRLLQRLNYLEVRGCAKLKVIDNEAPNVSSFTFEETAQYNYHSEKLCKWRA